jgi:hypothetical protein
MATKKTTGESVEPQAEEAPLKLADEQTKAVEQAETAAEESGTPSPTREPDKVKTPIPGTTEDLDVVSTDDATSLNPNVVVSGTKPDGKGGQQLLDVVDPAVANAALIAKPVNVKPETSSEAPEAAGAPVGEGDVKFRCTVDNEPFYHGGPMKKDQVYTMSKEEADVLTGLKAGQVETGSPPPSDDNAKVDGSDV